MAIRSGTGQGGKSMQDRELAARVRTLTLNEIEKVLKFKRNKRLYEAVLVKLAGSVLPRLNEHTGEDGGPIQVIVPKVVADAYDIPINKKTGRGDSKSGEI